MPTGPFMNVSPNSTLANHATADLGDLRALPDGIVSDWNCHTIAVYDRDPTQHDMLSTRLEELVSPRFREILEKVAAGQIQFLPVRLQSLDGKTEYQGFSMLHPLLRLPISDAEQDQREYLVFRPPRSRWVRVSPSMKALIESENLAVRLSS